MAASLLSGLPLSAHSFGKRPKEDSLDNRITAAVKKKIPSEVRIENASLYGFEELLLLKVTDSSGVVGITVCNARMHNLTSIFSRMVVPFFLGKDARNIAHLVSEIHQVDSNYKYEGMPFWNCVGTMEIALWDLLGNLAEVPTNHFLGGRIRNEVPIYLSSLTRDNSAAEETRNIVRFQETTGARAVKLKVGGRLKNTLEDIERTQKFIPLVRKTLGDDFTIYADSNGSYTVDEAKEVVRFLEDYGVAILEEPCYWQDYKANAAIRSKLVSMKLAGGEQDSSFHRFEAICNDKVYDILQPDVYYNGGLVRTLKIAHMAKEFDIGFAPHSPKADPLFAPFSQLASVAPVLTGFQEYPLNGTERQKTWCSPNIVPVEGKIPLLSANGLGISYDKGIWKNAKKL